MQDKTRERSQGRPSSYESSPHPPNCHGTPFRVINMLTISVYALPFDAAFLAKKQVPGNSTYQALWAVVEAAIPRLRQTSDWAKQSRQKSSRNQSIWRCANRQNSTEKRGYPIFVVMQTGNHLDASDTRMAG